MSTVFLNGEFLPSDQARVSVMDRGFLFGDGVYEVIPAYGGHLFRLLPHLQRLTDSLRAVRIPDPYTETQWSGILEELIGENPGTDQSVYLQVTRGVMDRRDHAFPLGLEPTVFAMSNPIPDPDPALAERGIAAISLDDIRWQSCHIKAITLLPNVLLRQQAVEAGAAEAILIRDGHATEGAASNLFIVRDGTLITPPKGPLLLPGITRDLVIELAAGHGVPHRENAIGEAELRTADEVWLTSSTKEIMPVTTLDGRPVGDGRPGPLYRRMHGLYREYKQAVREGRAG
ncbi:D-amino acid aminotransferase [Thiohalobacter thiocyanaticus]|uniref:Aminodeoxychorismate lyase n=1 Tax=Thiohalobacter thiocyanaticus TaxID=585455 RepID=A0A426QKS9_9GAMM|nr:D-amino acid aminotransferase [Thiohalobacter thiocyanaticus]RRQ22362.1 D-amino acid aminotransferase [Thiohalobacter thiocyanaticus]